MKTINLFSKEKALANKNKAFAIVAKILVLVLCIGLSYIVLYPFLFKILSAFMTDADLKDPLVEIVPAHWTLSRFTKVITDSDFLLGMLNTAFYALGAAALVTFSAAFVGYGIASFKFKGSGLIFGLVVFTMLIPLQTIYLPLYTTFRFFDIFGISTLFGGHGISLIDTPLPTFILAATCLGFRAGIFVILMRQYYIGIPKELIEAAYVDGCSVMGTYFKIVYPMARSMRIVVFSLSFAWQWTDTFYSGILNSSTKLLPQMVILMTKVNIQSSDFFNSLVGADTAAIVAVIPLIILFCFLQKKIIQGIETSGIVG